MIMVARGDVPPAPSPSRLLTEWELEPVAIALLALAALLYVAAVRRNDRIHPDRALPGRRLAAFLAGLALLAVAFLSPLATYADALFWVHMLQHLLVIFAAAPLLLLGAPILLARRVLGGTAKQALVLLLRSRVVHALTFPPVSWALFVGTLWASHLSGLYQSALEDRGVHLAEHALYLGTALLFWHPVIGLEPMRWRLGFGGRLLYLFLVVPANALLGVALYESVRPYPHYAGLARDWGPSVVGDQQAAGALMWIVGGLGMLVAALLVAVAWARADRLIATPGSRASSR